MGRPPRKTLRGPSPQSLRSLRPYLLLLLQEKPKVIRVTEGQARRIWACRLKEIGSYERCFVNILYDHDDRKTVKPYDRKTVKSHDRKTVKAYDLKTVKPYYRKTIKPYDRKPVKPYDRKTVRL